MKFSFLCLFAFVKAAQAIDKQALWDNEQAMFYNDMDGREGLTEACTGDHSVAISMNNPGCLRSEAARTCLFIGPDTYLGNWCFQSFDDVDCECQSMGEPLNVGSGASMVLNNGAKSYSFRVGGCTDRKEWKCHK